MNKKIDIFKISDYDKFKCTADKCKFTCCEGWDISIDKNTYEKWGNKKLSNILKKTKKMQCDNKVNYFMDKETEGKSPFLDVKGLCEIVKDYGDEYLPVTCREFPRIENEFDGRKEYSLSCSCPEVVEIIKNIDGKIEMISDDNISSSNNLIKLKVRDTIIRIIQNKNLGLDFKLIISFQLLLDLIEIEDMNENNLLELLKKYEQIEYMKELSNLYKNVDINKYESLEELNYLFLDIVQNYKEVSSLNIILEDVSNTAEVASIKSLSYHWSNYKKSFTKYEALLENCIVSKIFNSCISSNLEDVITAFQMIVVEFLLVRYAVFLRYSKDNNREIDTNYINESIVAFSRIIGNNSEAVVQFFKDGFGDEILELGYLIFITLF